MARIVKLQQNNETVYPKTVTEAVFSPEHGTTVDNVLKDLGNTGVSVFAEILAQEADIEIQKNPSSDNKGNVVWDPVEGNFLLRKIGESNEAAYYDQWPQDFWFNTSSVINDTNTDESVRIISGRTDCVFKCGSKLYYVESNPEASPENGEPESFLKPMTSEGGSGSLKWS